MVKINLYLSNTEDYVEIQINNCSEFLEFVAHKLKISHFNLLFDQGEKISKKKMNKFDEILNKKCKERDSVDILLITSDNIHSHTALTKQQEELVKLNSLIEKIGFNSSYINSNFKKILETVFFITAEFKKFENQQKIIFFLNNFYKNMLEKIGKQLVGLNDVYSKFKLKKEELEHEDTFNHNLSEFKQLFTEIKNLSTDIKIIEKSFTDFCKFYNIFEEKLKSFNSSYNNFKEKNVSKLKDSNLHPLPENLKDVKERIGEIFDELINLGNNTGKSQIGVKEVFIRVENYWNANKLSSYIEAFNNFHKLRRANSSKIRSMLDDECSKLKKGIIEKLSEINFFKVTIDNNLEIALLPEIFKKEFTEIENEIEKRREFDYVFQTITNFLNTNLLIKEERRRKEFSDRIYKYCKNDLYKNMFNKIYEKFTLGSDKIPEKLLNCTELVENNLNHIVEKLYSNESSSSLGRGFLDNQEEILKSEKMNEIHNENIPPKNPAENPLENNIKNYPENHPKNHPENHPENNLNPPFNSEIDSKAFTLFINEHLENLNKLQSELKKILKENFRIRDFSQKDENALSKQSSEAVLIDREELTDNNKFSPIINLEEILLNIQKMKNEDKITAISEHFITISSLIKRLGDVSRIPETSINLDISNTSLINSIYLSNMMTNDKNTNINLTNNIQNYQNYGNFFNNHIEDNKNTYVEIEKFIIQHEDKLFFYDVLFDYMSNFIKAKKVRYNLIRDKPQTLGTLIENILRDWLKSKRSLEKFAQMKKMLKLNNK